jgi:hypothetical protein
MRRYQTEAGEPVGGGGDRREDPGEQLVVVPSGLSVSSFHLDADPHLLYLASEINGQMHQFISTFY